MGFFEACFEAWGVVSYIHRTKNLKMFKQEFPMKNKFNLAIVSLSKINRQHIQLFFVLLTLTMLVLGAGAPDDGGGSTR